MVGQSGGGQGMGGQGGQGGGGGEGDQGGNGMMSQDQLTRLMVGSCVCLCVCVAPAVLFGSVCFSSKFVIFDNVSLFLHCL